MVEKQAKTAKKVETKAKPAAKASRPSATTPPLALVKKMKTAKRSVAKNIAKADKGVGCGDKNCPIHNGLKTRGRVFDGVVASDKMQGTVSVQWTRQVLIPKYERYLVRQTKVSAHNPACIGVKTGDKVRIAECRPLSKTVSFVVISKYLEDVSSEDKK